MNLQESVNWFKLKNEIPKHHTLWKESLLYLYQLYVLDDNLVPRAFCLTDIRWGTNDTPFPPSDIRKERCPGYEIGFMTKY